MTKMPQCLLPPQEAPRRRLFEVCKLHDLKRRMKKRVDQRIAETGDLLLVFPRDISN